MELSAHMDGVVEGSVTVMKGQIAFGFLIAGDTAVWWSP
jgi:hypothetical protein